MPSREILEAEAAALGINAANVVNDSVLEQKILYAMTQLSASGAATTLAPSTSTKARISGGKNV